MRWEGVRRVREALTQWRRVVACGCDDDRRTILRFYSRHFLNVATTRWHNLVVDVIWRLHVCYMRCNAMVFSVSACLVSVMMCVCVCVCVCLCLCVLVLVSVSV